MEKNKTEITIEELITPVLDLLGYELVDIEYKKEGPHWYLRIFIDKDGGITIDDCQHASEKISDLLDEADPIKQSYFLEVSSPGIERPLKKVRDFEKAKGKMVEIKLFERFKGEKVYQGKLIGFEDGQIHVDIDNNEVTFNQQNVAIIRPLVKF